LFSLASAPIQGGDFSAITPRIYDPASHALAADGKTKMRLLAENGDYFRTYTLDYADGERYPRLHSDPVRGL
jgi:hypothetical protein